MTRFDPLEYGITPPPPERPTIEEFLLARFDDLGSLGVSDVMPYETLRRMRAALVQVVEWHKNWPVLVETPLEFERLPQDEDVSHFLRYEITQRMAFVTQEEFKKRFGTLPPAAPLLRKMAQLYKDHPDYNHKWDD